MLIGVGIGLVLSARDPQFAREQLACLGVDSTSANPERSHWNREGTLDLWLPYDVSISCKLHFI